MHPVPMLLNEHNVLGSYGYTPGDIDEVIMAMSDGAYDSTGWVETMALDELVPAIEQLLSGNSMKILLPAH